MICFISCIAKTQVQHVYGQARGPRKEWYLLEKQFAPKCLAAVLGVGNSRLNRLRQGWGDRRTRLWGAVTGRRK